MTKFVCGIMVLFAYGCSSDKPATEKPAVTDTVSANTHATENARPQTHFYYEPDTSVIEGVLTTEMHYGPPGFGEDTVNDMKENVYMLQLTHPINVDFKKGTENELYRPAKDADKIQLLILDLDTNPYMGKTVRLKGLFFGAHTGHHFTDVLMDVKGISLQQ